MLNKESIFLNQKVKFVLTIILKLLPLKKITFAIIILLTTTSISQNLELRTTPNVKSEIFYKNGNKERGFIRMSSSVFKIKFKENLKGKERKVDFKDVERIVVNPDSTNERVFQYLDNYKHKYKVFVELVHLDELNIYFGSSNELSLFYSDYDLSSATEWMDEMRNRQSILFQKGLKLTEDEIPDLKDSYRKFYDRKSMLRENDISFNYYLAKSDNILIPVEKYRLFKKKYLQYIGDCPKFIEAYENEEVNLNSLPVFVEYYKETCD